MIELSPRLQKAKEKFGQDHAHLRNPEFENLWQQQVFAWQTLEVTDSDQPPHEHPAPAPLSIGGRDTLLRNAQAQSHRVNAMPAERNSLVTDQELDPNGGGRDFVYTDSNPLPSMKWTLSLHEDVQKAMLASLSSNASGVVSPQSVMPNETSLEEGAIEERKNFLRKEINFNLFSKAVLGDLGQYAGIPTFPTHTWRNGEPISLGIIFAARARWLEEILTREGQSCHQSGDMPRELG
jgi:hypothetical protein